MKTATLTTDLSPELSAVEATLASAIPRSETAVFDRLKARTLLESCRLTQPDAPNIAEAIVDAGEREITVSLRRYVKMERFQAMVLGVVFGLIVGAIVNLIGLAVILQYWK